MVECGGGVAWRSVGLVQCGALFSSVWGRENKFRVVQCGGVLLGEVWGGAMQCDALWCSVVQCMLCSVLHLSEV